MADATTPEEKVLPTLPLVFTSREGVTRQIGVVTLQEDGTMLGEVYAGGKGALPALFSMDVFVSIDGNRRMENNTKENN